MTTTTRPSLRKTSHPMSKRARLHRIRDRRAGRHRTSRTRIRPRPESSFARARRASAGCVSGACGAKRSSTTRERGKLRPWFPVRISPAASVGEASHERWIRPPPQSQRLLAPGRRLPPRPSRRAREEPRHARAGAHRSRKSLRSGRILREGARGGAPAHRGLRGLRGPRVQARPHAKRGRKGRVRPPRASRQKPGGLPEPHAALLGGIHGGLPLQASDRQGAPVRARGRAPLSQRVSPRRAAAAGSERRPGGRAERRRVVPRPLRQGVLLLRSAGSRHPRRAHGGAAADRAGQGDGDPGGRDERLPLSASAGRRSARSAALHPDRQDAPRSGPLPVRDRSGVREIHGRDGGALPGRAGGAPEHPGGRGEMRADARHRARSASGVSSSARIPDRRGIPAQRGARGTPAPIPERGRGDGAAAPVRARHDLPGGLRALLPHRARLHRFRALERDRRGSGPRIGGGEPRLLRARHHRHRPAQVRSPLRALPESRADQHARHRHRFRLREPRPRHRVRAREIRPRQRDPDHHVRDDGGPRGGARRGPGARHDVRGPGPGREAGARGAGDDPDARARDRPGAQSAVHPG